MVCLTVNSTLISFETPLIVQTIVTGSELASKLSELVIIMFQ